MSMFSESKNPMFKEETLRGGALDEGMVTQQGRMTVAGAVNKTLILMGVMFVGAVIGFAFPNPIFMWGGIFGGAILYFYTSKNVEKSPTLAPIYAGIQGLLAGTISAMYAAAFFPGIIFHAVTLTFALLFTMLMLYKSGLITVTEKFRAGVSMAVGAVMLLYLVNIVLYFFGVTIPFLHDGGPIAIGISLVIIAIASMNLLLDFDNFDKGERHNAPAYMEWYFGMGLLFTLVWLYLEILRLLSYFMGSD